ncbi:MAG: DNA-binding protein [Desulfobacterales bacterium]
MDGQGVYITEKEVSIMTRRALSTLRNDRFHRRGISYYKIGRSVRYSINDVIRFMEAGKIMTENNPYAENKQN